MSKPIINNLAASMGTHLETPVVNISFNLYDSETNTCHIDPSGGLQYAYASASGVWYNATPHESTPLSNLASYATAPGRSTNLLWDVDADLSNTDENFLIKVIVTDSNDEDSDAVVTSPFRVDVRKPVVSINLDDYTNQLTYSFGLTTSGEPSHYRISESPTMNGIAWNQYDGNSNVSITFTSSTQEQKKIYVQVRDEYYNLSEVVSDTIIYHTSAPINTFVRINGTIPDNEIYTGIKINPDGSFSPDRNILLDLYAEDLYDIDVYIDGDVESGSYTGQWFDLKKNGSIVVSSVNLVLGGADFNYDATNNISIDFRDSAGNISRVNKSIRLNTKIYKCNNRLLREPNTEYNHQVYKVLQSGSTEIVQEKLNMNDNYLRKWDDIFYPSSHDYPRNTDGTIDETACIAMNQTSNAYNDAVRLSGGNVQYDSEGRPSTVDWTDDGTKDYNDMESSYNEGLRYWIIDNTGYGDINLAFEFFDLDSNAYGPPFNTLSPHKGDCVVLYDASAPGATEEIYGPTGKTDYILKDSSELKELYAYTGSGNNIMDLVSGYSVNSDINGGFTVPAIRGINRICLILYTDASHAASGFKLKADRKHTKVFKNYDIDESNGELWLHQYPNGQNYNGDMRMIYDYYDTEIIVDVDKGEAKFVVEPSGIITADYSYYLKQSDKMEEDITKMFVAVTDDFVDYLEPQLFVTPSGTYLDKSVNYEFAYPVPVCPSGQISSNYTVDKDRGIVEFFDGTSEYSDEFAYVPDGRLTLDYFAHTFKRLSNDGNGVLLFRDKTIVADDTPLFPDYTWVDVKVVNEGNAALEDGKLFFVSRGYDTDGDGIVDQVLDVNRPWDIQEGTADETYTKTAMEVRQNYTFSQKPSKNEARDILSNWKNRVFGFDVNPRTQFFGRVVWVIGGTSGNSYPATSVGRKTFSAEVQGKFYNIET